jgi:hypothetical protein
VAHSCYKGQSPRRCMGIYQDDHRALADPARAKGKEMLQILEAVTLLRLLDAAPGAVRHTVETGEWTGCLWPGHPEWEIHEACVQIRSLALHYFTVRYPAAEAQRYDTAAQLLASQVCPQGGATHLSAEPLVDQALLWLWTLAGGPVPPNAPRNDAPPPRSTAGQLRLPGGNAVAFTTAALALWEALLFTGETAARQVAETFLRARPDPLAQRALRLVDALRQQDTSGYVDVGIACVDCGAQDLEVWYTGQMWGETLCTPCYEARVAQGQARPHGL